MKRFFTLTVILIITMLSSACGATVTPTTNAVDIQNTALAAALTIIAQTQAAFPTSTPIPPTETPTETPFPTETALVLPTSQATLTFVPTSNSGGGDPCATRVLAASPNGSPTIIRISNTTRVSVTVSLYLNETAAHGECGYRAYTIPARQDVVITDLIQGCYNVWAWSDAATSTFSVASGTSCINNSDKWEFQISADTIKFTS